MSVQKPYLIANLRTGLDRSVEPWILPEDAFPDLEDCYMFRGRIPRRKGFVQLGRIVTTVGIVDTFNNLPVMGLRTRELTTRNEEQLIAFDTTKANRYSNVLSKFVDITFNQPGNAAPFSWTGSDSDFFWTTNYADAFWATNNTPGFQAVNNATNPALGDGLRFYDGVQWFNFLPRVDNTGVTFLMGALLIVSYRNRLVMLNTLEGTAFGADVTFAQRARWSQNGTPFVNAVPAGYTGGAQVDAWDSITPGKGGFIDAPTQEQIISAEFFKDTLIVYFERSTWQLRYTGNELLPFIWERINVELGAESTFSIVPFDSGILAVGNVGIMTCNSVGVQRIDQIIPDEVFKIHNGNDGVKRVYGIRDFTQQLVYWTFPDDSTNPTYPNRVLVYNYLDGSYSFFNDSFTCFGYWSAFPDLTWADVKQAWGSMPVPWNSGQFQSGYPKIVAGNQQGFVFQNYNNGGVANDFSLFLTGITNAAQAVVTSPNHNLLADTIIVLDQIVGMSLAIGPENDGTALANTTSFTGILSSPPIFPTSATITIGANVFTDDGEGNLVLLGVNSGTINYTTGVFTAIYPVLLVNTAVTSTYTKSLNNNIFNVSDVTTNTFKIQILDINGNFVYVDTTALAAYASGGFIKVRNNFLINTKRFNPFLSLGDQVRIQNIDFFLETSDDLNFNTTIFLDENQNSSVESDVVIPSSQTLGKVWVRGYYSAIGQFVQLEMRFSNEQMFDPNFSDGNFTLHALMIWMSNAGRLTYGVPT
jgi:hypothetical protein